MLPGACNCQDTRPAASHHYCHDFLRNASSCDKSSRLHLFICLWAGDLWLLRSH